MTIDQNLAIDDLCDSVVIDWLTIYQVYPYGHVPVSGSEFSVTYSLETGELVAERVRGFQHAGSFETSVHVRCDGSTVIVSGNPSALNRMDNLYGVRSVEDAVSVFNRVLHFLGLPVFRDYTTLKGKDVSPYSQTQVSVKFYESQKFKPVIVNSSSAFCQAMIDLQKPRITRIDLAVIFATSNANAFLRQISTYCYKGRAGYLYPNGSTVDWPMMKGSNRDYSRRVYHKYYDKAKDISDKLVKLIALQKKNPFNLEIKRHLDYIQKLYLWAKDNGIIRREVSFKSTELTSRGLTLIENWSRETMSKIIYPYQFHDKIKLEETRLSNIYEYLIEKGYTHGKAQRADALHRAWVNGDDVRARAGSRQTFDRYRNILLSCGVDIKEFCDISKLQLRVEKFDWRNIKAPQWYKHPSHSDHDFKRVA